MNDEDTVSKQILKKINYGTTLVDVSLMQLFLTVPGSAFA